MLGKLLKHEFRATARVMLPLFGVLLALSVLGNLSTRILDSDTANLLNILGGLVIAAFFIAMFAVCLMSVVIMVQRFHNNLLTDEGYLMFTLPVSVHSLVWSKIIVSVVWFVGTGIVVFLSILLVTFRVEYMSQFADQVSELFRHLSEIYTFNTVAITVEFLIMMLLSGIALCLLFYAAMAVGYGFSKHKRLLSVVFFFAFQFAMQIVVTLLLSGFREDLDSFFNTQDVMAVWHGVSGIAIASELIYCAVFYFFTTYSLKKWIAKNKVMLICGHTHRFRYPAVGQLPYFNTGSCVYPTTITNIEIEGGGITLVRWQVFADAEGSLRVTRTPLGGPVPIREYDIR